MSSSQLRRWQEDFARLQAQYQQRAFIPIDRRTPGLVQGVKAGISLVALSPEPTAPTLWKGQDCYGSDGVKVTGTGVVKQGSALASDNTERSTASTSYVDVTGVTHTGSLDGKLLLCMIHNGWASTCNATLYLQLLEDAVSRMVRAYHMGTGESTDNSTRALWYEVPWGTGSKTWKLQFKADNPFTVYVKNCALYGVSLSA